MKGLTPDWSNSNAAEKPPHEIFSMVYMSMQCDVSANIAELSD